MKRRNSVTNALSKQYVKTLYCDEIKTSNYYDASEEFLKHCFIKGLSPETVKFYAKELKQMGRGLAEVNAPLTDVRKLKTLDIENFIEYLLGIGRATSTINSRLRAGRTYFNFCLRKDYINANPFDGVQQLKQRHEVGATFSKRQLKLLLDAPDLTTFIGLRDLAIMLTFAHTGVRLTELTSLRVQDLSFDDKGEVNVQRAKNRYGRRIPLTRRLRDVLQAYMQERGQMDTDSLFITVDNQPIGARSIQDRLHHYGKQTEVDKEVAVSPHAFRRTFCRLKVEAGTNIFVLQRLTGHQSLEILRRYVEIYAKDLEGVIENGLDGT